METPEIKKIIEAIIFVADQPLPDYIVRNTLGELAVGLDIPQLLSEIAAEYEARNGAFELRNIAGGWQFATRMEFSPWIRKLHKDKTVLRLSNSALESLSVVAYKQPVTRAEIEEIRGVEAGGVLDTLLERKLVRVVGRKETLGRPLLYGTTAEFLKHFGLSHLSELPSLEELTPPESAATEAPPELPFEGDAAQAAAADTPVEEPAPAQNIQETEETPQ